MIRRLAIVAAAMTLALAASSCNEEPEPRFDPDASLTPTGSPTTAPSSATPDAEPLTSVQTVRAWVKARNKTMKTGDSTQVYALSSTNCKTCEDWVEPILDVHEKGGRFEGTGWRLVRAKEDPKFAKNRTVNTAIDYGAGRTWPSKGAKPVEYESETDIVTFRLVKQGDEWLVDAILHLS